jgi:NAD(P)H-dependent flavin oxidoreductase YrpB (nitropropane dioxygenase family)
MFEIEYPIFLAGMGGVAYADVCAAVSEAGGYGTLGMAAENPTRIREEMRRVRALTQKPFGVDLLAALPNSVLAAIDVIIEEGANAFIRLQVNSPNSCSLLFHFTLLRVTASRSLISIVSIAMPGRACWIF